jgi:threonine/homoserine/homoserine lactone efflux protein
MDFLDALLLLGLGFFVGLSGAVMPGPLLVYTVNESLRKGKWVGAYVILGHAMVEVAIFAVLALGLIEFISSPALTKAIAVIGGTALIVISLNSLKRINSRIPEGLEKARYGSVAGGIIFTAFNPGFPIWWLTAGAALLAAGYKEMSYLGMVLVFLGHWAADLGWFLFVSMTTYKGSRYLFEKGWYHKARILLSAVLFLIGIYFLSTALG